VKCPGISARFERARRAGNSSLIPDHSLSSSLIVGDGESKDESAVAVLVNANSGSCRSELGIADVSESQMMKTFLTFRLNNSVIFTGMVQTPYSLRLSITFVL
jgi:hypothetical protein